MGWLWRNDDSSSGDASEFRRRKVVRSLCHTEEVEHGKLIRKCDKTEEIYKVCLGRPSEMVESHKQYTEEDVTNQIDIGSFPWESAYRRSSYFPGLRRDIEAVERSVFGVVKRFIEAVEEMRIDPDSVPARFREPKEALHKEKPNGDADRSGLAREV